MDLIDILFSRKFNKGSGGGSGTTNYNQLNNKPKINNIELSGNKTLEALGISSTEDVALLQTKIEEYTGVVVAGEGTGSTIQGLMGNENAGTNNTATGDYAHVEGGNASTSSQTGEKTYFPNTASGLASHAEGQNTTASGMNSHAEGGTTTATGESSHAEGNRTTASGFQSHAEGNFATASGNQSHAEGQSTIAFGTQSHAEGCGGTYTLKGTEYESGAKGTTDHTEGYQTLTASVTGDGNQGNHAEGYRTQATGGAAHAEGNSTTASGMRSHAEGDGTTASGPVSHAEGNQTTAGGALSHAEGTGTTASGPVSHAEGQGTIANGNISHAEGDTTTASGAMSHAEGRNTIASGNQSHAEGNYTIANHASQHVFGEYNIADPSAAAGNFRGTYIEIVGNGTKNGTTESRSNARTLDWDGNEVLKGGLTVGAAGITIGNTTITESQLIYLLSLVQSEP